VTLDGVRFLSPSSAIGTRQCAQRRLRLALILYDVSHHAFDGVTPRPCCGARHQRDLAHAPNSARWT